MRKYELSIVTIVNNIKTFRKFLQHSLEQQTDISYELIVIDNTEHQYDSLSKAYSKGIREAHSDWILFIHPDVLFLNNRELSNLVHMVNDSLKDDIKIGVWGVAGADINGKVISQIRDNVSYIGHRYNTYDNSKKYMEVKSLDACCWLVKKEQIKQIGFMEHSKGFHLVVEEVCIHLEKMGYKAVVLPVKIHHYSDAKQSYDYTYWREAIKIVNKYDCESFLTTSHYIKKPFLLLKLYYFLIRCYVYRKLVLKILKKGE